MLQCYGMKQLTALEYTPTGKVQEKCNVMRSIRNPDALASTMKATGEGSGLNAYVERPAPGKRTTNLAATDVKSRCSVPSEFSFNHSTLQHNGPRIRTQCVSPVQEITPDVQFLEDVVVVLDGKGTGSRTAASKL
jgi:hypothetical protein